LEESRHKRYLNWKGLFTFAFRMTTRISGEITGIAPEMFIVLINELERDNIVRDSSVGFAMDSLSCGTAI
jgi:hypothetical protein